MNEEPKMKRFLLFTFGLLMAVIMLAYQPIGQSAGDRILKPGDEIDGMVITTGVAEASPLWAFCSHTLETDNVTHGDCQVPQVSKLAIGHPFGGADRALQALDWSTLTWALSLDEHSLDLEAFGIYHYAIPDLASPPSPIREVFRQKKTWDVVLTNPTPGLHTLHGMARAGTNTYTWIVNFTVKTSLVSK
jgi:hypothetical protein